MGSASWCMNTNSVLNSIFHSIGVRPNRAVNTHAHRRGFARAVVAGYLER